MLRVKPLSLNHYFELDHYFFFNPNMAVLVADGQKLGIISKPKQEYLDVT